MECIPAMTKLDLKKELKELYTAKKKPEIVDVPPGRFLSVLGRGAPEGDEYAASIGALYSLSYTLKFMSKEEGQDFVVMPLETLWWFDDPTASADEVPREKWNWKTMIRQPDFIKVDTVERIKPEVAQKKQIHAVKETVLESLDEGLSAQIMHIGPYSDEKPTILRLMKFITENSYRTSGRHHEIYLSDPNRTAPERLKTIIRLPVEEA
jgi:hypothetical protein